MDILRGIKTFQVVVEQGSFSKAANQLGVVVSAVSRQVSDLEAHFGCQLLYRTSRAMNLTAEGEYFLEQFGEVVERLDGLAQRADLNKQAISAHIRMSAPSDAEQLGITDLVSVFARQHPGVKVTLMLLNRYVNLVEEGIDLAIRVHELPDSRLVARRYTELNVHFVASADYLAKHGTPQHPKELSSHTCVLDGSTRTPTRWRYFESGAERHVTVSGAIEVNSGKLTADYSATGHGIAYLPDFLVQNHLESGALVTLLESLRAPPAPVSLVYPASRINNPTLSALVRHLLENRSARGT